jgi:hypothetical protein
MKNLSVVPSLFVLMIALAAAAHSNAPRRDARVEAFDEILPGSPAAGNQKVHAESPIACVPDALSPAERKRHFDELSPLLRRLKTGVRELREGYEFQFPSDRKTYDLVSEWAIQEQLCCPFFELSVRLEREGGPLWLRLTGRKGVKEFIRDDFAPWFRE